MISEPHAINGCFSHQHAHVPRLMICSAIKICAGACWIWQVHCTPLDIARLRSLIIQAVPGEAYRMLDRGPAAESADAPAFRDFWGEKAELRRFQVLFACHACKDCAPHWRSWSACAVRSPLNFSD